MNTSRLIAWTWVLAGLGGTANAITIQTVPVGNPGNPGELSGLGSQRVCGSVAYEYRIGKYEITAGQYCEFLNKVAASDRYGLYYQAMSFGYYGQGCRIQRTGTPGSYRYNVASEYANRPVNYVGWDDAARFANWLHNGQPTGNQNASTTEDGAYDMSGTQQYYGPNGETPLYGSSEFTALNYAITAIPRKPGWTWAIQSEDEWYKAAYHKNDGVTGHYFDYPTRSYSIPGRNLDDPFGNNANYYIGTGQFPIDPPYYTTVVGEFQNSASPYGTFDQGGNVWEWNEAVINGPFRGNRGGCFAYDNAGTDLHAGQRTDFSNMPSYASQGNGFRVVRVPEPSALVLVISGALAFSGRGRKPAT